MEIMSLGNDDLNHLLGGGIVKGKSTILTGSYESGLSSVALQFLLDSAHESDSSAYICIDTKPELIMERAMQYYNGINNRIQNNTLKFVEVSIQDWNVEQDINDLLLSIQLQIDALFQNFECQRVVINSLLPQLLISLSTDKKVYFIKELYNILSSYKITSLCLLYDESLYDILFLDQSYINDQLLFQKQDLNNYNTYSLKISTQDKNKNGTYRFRFNNENKIKVVNKL